MKDTRTFSKAAYGLPEKAEEPHSAIPQIGDPFPVNAVDEWMKGVQLKNIEFDKATGTMTFEAHFDQPITGSFAEPLPHFPPSGSPTTWVWCGYEKGWEKARPVIVNESGYP